MGEPESTSFNPHPAGESDAPRGGSVKAGPSPLRVRDIRRYDVCDRLSGFLVYFMVIFSPWAFGTTQPWSIWTMNVAGYLLGVLLFAKLALRRLKGYRPGRWEPVGTDGARHLHRVTTLLAAVTVMFLAYCLVSALNASATWLPNQWRFNYHPHVEWLPHSHDSGRSWRMFANYLALACAFWGIRDWLLGKTQGETRASRHHVASKHPAAEALLPARLRGLLWVLCINGALLGIEGIAQRIEGSGRLLWLVQPRVNPGAESQFGPYAYRANAAQYFNLLWPVCLGFWWTLHRTGGFMKWRHHLLLPCGVIMAACPVISTSRGGAIITALLLAMGAVTLLVSHFLLPRRRGRGWAPFLTVAVLGVFFGAAVWLGYHFGWERLSLRMEKLDEGYTVRERMYEIARPIADDYPVFGTGPGTFAAMFQFYRGDPDEYWPAQLHNDWLETRITFGLAGSALLALALAGVLARWFIPGGIHGGRRFLMLAWLAFAGVLAHARFDFPFQIYSIVFLFVTLCAALSCLSRRP